MPGRVVIPFDSCTMIISGGLKSCLIRCNSTVIFLFETSTVLSPNYLFLAGEVLLLVILLFALVATFLVGDIVVQSQNYYLGRRFNLWTRR